jgi:ABC-2 type transport system permease protein
MRALIEIARIEGRRLMRRRSYAVLLGLFAVLVVTAAALSAERQGRERKQRAGYQEQVRAQWESQPDRHPHRVAHYGTFAFKPVGPLAAFDPGVESFSGRIQFLEAHRQNAANFSEAGALSSAFRLGELSLSFLLQVCLPLILIVLGHRVFSGETESGRLRLLLAQGARVGPLLGGKAAGLALASLPFLAVIAVATVAVSGQTGSPAWDRLAALTLAGGLYLAAWIGLTLWTSARARTSNQALALLVGVWVACCVILPRATAAFATAAHPAPSKSQFTEDVAAEIHRLGDTHNASDQTFDSLRDRILRDYGVTRVEDLPVNYGALVMTEGESLSAEVFNRHYGRLDETYRRQNRVLALSALLNPSAGFRVISAAISGTDYEAQSRFLREAEAYRYSFVQELNALHRDKIRYVNDRDQRLEADHWDVFPDFKPTQPSLAESLLASALGWAGLALWALVPAFFLFRHRVNLA